MTGYVMLQGSAFELATTILDGSLRQALCLLPRYVFVLLSGDLLS